MFESIVASVLNSALGKFIDGLDADALSISVFKGEVELFDLNLKDSAFDGLGYAGTMLWRRRVRPLPRSLLRVAHAAANNLCIVANEQCSCGPRGRQGGPHQAVRRLEEPQHEGNPH